MESPDDFESSDEVHDAVGGVLLESIESSNEVAVLSLCSRLYSTLIGDESGGGEACDKVTGGGKKLLDAPVHLAAKLKDQGG